MVANVVLIKTCILPKFVITRMIFLVLLHIFQGVIICVKATLRATFVLVRTLHVTNIIYLMMCLLYCSIHFLWFQALIVI